uniref:Zinc carboxypeptidase A 1 n=1 Tax=Plectus sambesii TaxID=2011161 RepID=A0A914W889_9BILA
MVQIQSLLVLTLIATALGYKRYDGYKVLQVKPQNEDQVRALVKTNQVLGFEVDFWRDARAVGRNCDFMIPPEKESLVMDFLAYFGITPKVVVNDVSVMIDRSMKEQQEKPEIDWKAVKADPNQFPLDQYHTHDDIGTPKPNKNALWIDAGVHAREWIADATALYTISQLVNGYSTKFKTLLDTIDIIIAPSVNPDGYEYSRLTDRNWRKTRSGPRQGCYGVDANRNWSFHWGESGVSTNPCSDVYDGPSPFTEKNTQNMKAYLDANNKTIKGMITLHSYGEDWTYPWSYKTNTYPPDVNDLKALALQAAAAIQAIHGTKYLVGNTADSLTPAAGGSDDYSKSIGIKWVYTVELRPGDGDTANDHQYGFNLPAEFIIPTAEETFPGLMVVANRIMTGPN